MVARNSDEHSLALQIHEGRAVLDLSAPLTAGYPVGVNPIVDAAEPVDTLDRVRAVLAFLTDWNARTPCGSFEDERALGLDIILQMVDDGVAHASAQMARRRGQ